MSGFQIFIIICIGILIIYLYRKSASNISTFQALVLTCIRSIIVLITVLFIYNFSFYKTKISYRKKQVIFLVDTSESMTVQDIGEMRFNKAMSILKDLLNSWGNNFHIKIIEFSSEAKQVRNYNKMKPNGKSTSIKKALDKIKDEKCDVVLLSDGIDNDTTEYIDYTFQDINPKIFSIGIGRDGIKDVKLVDVTYPRTAVQGDDIYVKAVILQENAEGEKVNILIKEGGNVVSSSNIVLKDYENIVDLKFKAKKPGLAEYQIEVVPDFKEKIWQNNFKKIYIKIFKDKFNGVLLSGAPSYEFSFLKREISKFEKFEFTYFVFQNENKLYPISPDRKNILSNISSSDVLILQDIPPHYLSDEEKNKIKNFVLNRKGILLLGGEESFLANYYKNKSMEELLFLLPFEPSDRKNYTEDIFNTSVEKMYCKHPAVSL